jgi:hypothetical protein
MTEKKHVCPICRIEIEACNSCHNVFEKGERVIHFMNEHFCDKDCLVDRLLEAGEAEEFDFK